VEKLIDAPEEVASNWAAASVRARLSGKTGTREDLMTISQRFSSDIPILAIDPFAENVLRNPAPYYAKLRAAGPLAVVEKYGILACGRYKETHEIFFDSARFVSSRGVGLSDFKVEKPWRQPSIILEADPPEHSRARSVMARALSPRAVAGLKEKFRDAAELLIERLVERQEFDAVKDLAEAFPLKVFPDAVGIADEGREILLAYGRMVFNALGPDNPARRQAFASAPSVVTWIERHCHRNAITSEGFAATIYAAADAGELTEQEAGLLVRSLLSAGVDTTVAALGSAMFCFATNPDQYALLRDDPQLARQAFDEVLRFTSPVHSFCRTANRDTEVSGVAIPEGAKILCVLGSANLDPEKWPNASKFDIARKPIGHLAFGTGIHACVGQSVARQEAEAVLAAVARTVQTIQLAGDPAWRPGNAIHALDRLPLRITRRP
jgi:4-methoxybenzoate monooxygenase (O-demethylating)